VKSHFSPGVPDPRQASGFLSDFPPWVNFIKHFTPHTKKHLSLFNIRGLC